MSWGELVHENRKRAELQRAREELRLRRRGYAVEEKPSAGISAVLTLAGALTAAAWWRKEGRKPHSRDWKSLPGISQLLDFLQPDSRPKRAPTRSKSKPKAQLAPPSKAAAARQAAGRKAAGPPRSGSSGGSTAAAAAGAAALQRASGGGGSSGAAGSSNAAEQPEASTSGSDWVPVAEQRVLAHQQSKPKKKKNKKKK